ncbi:hypothetical protein IFM89_016856 [Coptis chinensis]|uniref:Uncharacterized protein n=1 Tax=Coptis chinensis TaxID=261450 RepID=A0A835LB51_9MAGN|nr:hypothetical protein IFM89_016856 [Coptis chinensis]
MRNVSTTPIRGSAPQLQRQENRGKETEESIAATSFTEIRVASAPRIMQNVNVPTGHSNIHLVSPGIVSLQGQECFRTITSRLAAITVELKVSFYHVGTDLFLSSSNVRDSVSKLLWHHRDDIFCYFLKVPPLCYCFGTIKSNRSFAYIGLRLWRGHRLFFCKVYNKRDWDDILGNSLG